MLHLGEGGVPEVVVVVRVMAMLAQLVVVVVVVLLIMAPGCHPGRLGITSMRLRNHTNLLQMGIVCELVGNAQIPEEKVVLVLVVAVVPRLLMTQVAHREGISTKHRRMIIHGHFS